MSAPATCPDVFPSVMLGPVRCELEAGHDGAHKGHHDDAGGDGLVRWVNMTQEEAEALAALLGDDPDVRLEFQPRGELDADA